MLRIDPAGTCRSASSCADLSFRAILGRMPALEHHAGFRDPGRLVTQIVEATDGERYFTLARTVTAS